MYSYNFQIKPNHCLETSDCLTDEFGMAFRIYHIGFGMDTDDCQINSKQLSGEF